jgi:HEAT repeat protein
MSLPGPTVPELVEQARAAAARDDENHRWDIVSRLHRHGGQAAFDAAVRLCRSPEALGRALGVDILAQLDPVEVPLSQRPFREATVRLLLDLVEGEQAPAVLQSIAVGFGHLRDPRCVAPLAALHRHPDPDVRHGVAFGLLGRPEREAMDILITLSADPDPDVRNWATFGLARQTDADFVELRQALAARVDDPDPDARAEALNGLATRGDVRALVPLLDALDQSSPVSDWAVIEDAVCALAAATGDRRLCAHVARLRDEWLADSPDDELPEDLRAAVARCNAPG